LDQPCGIEIFENRLLVGDYANGDIVVYDMENNFMELGRIHTDNPGLTGIKVGPDGNIWGTNRIFNTLSRIQPGDPVGTNDINKSVDVSIYPNPSSGIVNIKLPEDLKINNGFIQIFNTTGQLILRNNMSRNNFELDLTDLTNGLYYLEIAGDNFFGAQKFHLIK
jgi:hypothetical protein